MIGISEYLKQTNYYANQIIIEMLLNFQKKNDKIKNPLAVRGF